MQVVVLYRVARQFAVTDDGILDLILIIIPFLLQGMFTYVGFIRKSNIGVKPIGMLTDINPSRLGRGI